MEGQLTHPRDDGPQLDGRGLRWRCSQRGQRSAAPGWAPRLWRTQSRSTVSVEELREVFSLGRGPLPSSSADSTARSGSVAAARWADRLVTIVGVAVPGSTRRPDADPLMFRGMIDSSSNCRTEGRQKNWEDEEHFEKSRSGSIQRTRENARWR